jgi:hypothetical protein
MLKNREKLYYVELDKEYSSNTLNIIIIYIFNEYSLKLIQIFQI